MSAFSQQGRGTGIVLADDADLLSVSLALQSHTFAKFSLKYEELLERKDGRYEHTVLPTPPEGAQEVK